MPTDDDDEIIIIRRISVRRSALTEHEASELRDINMFAGKDKPLSFWDAFATAWIVFRVQRRP